MNVKTLIAAALVAAAVIAPSAQAYDGTLNGLSIQYVNAASRLNHCTGLVGCTNLITRTENIVTKIAARATLRMPGRPKCALASARFLAPARRNLRAIQTFGGSPTQAHLNTVIATTVAVGQSLVRLSGDC